jgi:hypothetical protein
LVDPETAVQLVAEGSVVVETVDFLVVEDLAAAEIQVLLVVTDQEVVGTESEGAGLGSEGPGIGEVWVVLGLVVLGILGPSASPDLAVVEILELLEQLGSEHLEVQECLE